MSSNFNWKRRLPLTILIVLAAAYEPIRSGFTVANQPCELVSSWPYVKAGLFNFRHLLGYGIICLAAAATFQNHRILKAVIVIFIFSALLELEQSFFTTGHCRARDLLPNLIAVGLAAMVFSAGHKLKQWLDNRKLHG